MLYQARIKHLAQALNAPFHDLSDNFCGEKLFQNSADVTAGLAGVERASLIIAHGYPEGMVTQLAITALLEGYNVFVPTDLTLCAEEHHRPLFYDRIRDAAGNVTTARQLLLDRLKRYLLNFARARSHLATEAITRIR